MQELANILAKLGFFVRQKLGETIDLCQDVTESVVTNRRGQYTESVCIKFNNNITT
jgi:hypothetical protein